MCTEYRNTSIYKENANSHKGEIDSNTIIVKDYNTTLSTMDITSKKKIKKETQALNDTLDQVNITDIYKTFHLKQQNTLSSQVCMEHSPR